MENSDNKLGTMPVRPLVLRMAWPIMLSMFISACYNLVDSIFVARISDDAFLALSLAYPVQTLMIAINVGTGAGINALLSRNLGQKRRDLAALVAENGIFLYLMIWCVYLLFGLFGVRFFFSRFTDSAVVHGYGVQYLSIVCCFSVGQTMEFASQRILHATGHPTGHMIVQGIGAVLNLILDPILIFGLFGLPALGVLGAAIATVAGQIIGGTVGLILVSRVREIRVTMRHFRPDGQTLKGICQIGLPAAATQALTPVMSAGLNTLLSGFSDALVLVLGIYFKLQTFVLMPIYGLNNGIVPVISYNFGAGNRRRITASLRFALSLALLLTLAVACLFELCPGFLLGFFAPSGTTLAAGIPALRIIGISFPFFACTLILSGSFQVLGAPRMTLLISVLRQLVIVLPVAWILCRVNPSLVWYALPVAEIVGAAITLVVYRRIYRSVISQLP